MKNIVKGLGIALVGTVAVIILIMWGAGIGWFSAQVGAKYAKATINAKVTQQIFDPTNKIQSQAYFESLYADYNGYLVKIHLQKELVAKDNSPYNQTNLEGLQQECINGVQSYNAAARSISSQAFRTADLPASLDANSCS